MKLKQLASTDERHLIRNFTFLKYQQTNGWFNISQTFKTHQSTYAHKCAFLSSKFLSSLRTLKSESRFSTLQLLWNRIKTRLENEEFCIIGCLMLWRCFQYELNSVITRIFTRFVHRNSKRRSYYILSMTVVVVGSLLALFRLFSALFRLSLSPYSITLTQQILESGPDD